MSVLLQTVPAEIVHLNPGEFYFGGGRVQVQTLLGSCVAITVWHPDLRIGGMCHYLLPTRGKNQQVSPGHFADEAIELFRKQLCKTNTIASQYEVKLFGGGNMFKVLGHENTTLNVAKNNIRAGIELLHRNGFSIKAQDVGGDVYRTVYLELWSGDVWVRRGTSQNLGEAAMQVKGFNT